MPRVAVQDSCGQSQLQDERLPHTDRIGLSVGFGAAAAATLPPKSSSSTSRVCSFSSQKAKKPKAAESVSKPGVSEGKTPKEGHISAKISLWSCFFQKFMLWGCLGGSAG